MQLGTWLSLLHRSRPVDGVAMPDPAPAQQLEASSESLNPAL